MTRGATKKVPPQRLYQLYIKQDLPGKEVAEALGISERTFWNLIDRYGLQRRSKPQDCRFCESCGALKDRYSRRS